MSKTGQKIMEDSTMKSYLEKFRGRFDQVKKIIGHVGLYVGLIVFTALGALVRRQHQQHKHQLHF